VPITINETNSASMVWVYIVGWFNSDGRGRMQVFLFTWNHFCQHNIDMYSGVTYIPSIWRGRSLWSVQLFAEPSGLVYRRLIAALRLTPIDNRSFVRRFGQPRVAPSALWSWNEKKNQKMLYKHYCNLLFKITFLF